MPVIGDGIQVYSLVEQWRFFVSASSVTGTRVYLDESAALPAPATLTMLPNIGDTWDDDYTNVTLKTIDISYVDNNDNCPKKYVCNYDSVPSVQTAVPLSADDLPIYVDVSGEQISWVPPKGTFEWASDNSECSQVIFKQVSLATVRMYRVVKTFDVYMATVMALAGKVNATAWRGFYPRTVMFQGANMTQFLNRLGQKRWKAELIFCARSVTKELGDWTDGWNFIVREENGNWDQPRQKVTTDRLYASVDFTPLFEVDELGDEEDFFQAFPDN
uniref:Uncharacterized protein n=1 Tax=viral metagenome TaxID=1070528 RepID=A0A6H1ZXT0_9ZZZZ